MKKGFVLLLIVIMCFISVGCGEAAKLEAFMESKPSSDGRGLNNIKLTPLVFIDIKNSEGVSVGITTKEGKLCFAVKDEIKDVELGKEYDFMYMGFKDTDIIGITSVNREITNDDYESNTVDNDINKTPTDPYEGWTESGYGDLIYKLSQKMKENSKETYNNGSRDMININMDKDLYIIISYVRNAIGPTDTFMNYVEKQIDGYNAIQGISIDKKVNGVQQFKNLKFLIYNSQNDGLTAIFNQKGKDVLNVVFTARNITALKEDIVKFIDSIQFK